MHLTRCSRGGTVKHLHRLKFLETKCMAALSLFDKIDVAKIKHKVRDCFCFLVWCLSGIVTVAFVTLIQSVFFWQLGQQSFPECLLTSLPCSMLCLLWWCHVRGAELDVVASRCSSREEEPTFIYEAGTPGIVF